MNSFNKNKRWYDEDPTLSLAISFIRNSSQEKQLEIAEKIIQKASDLGIKLNEVKIIIKRRWYDENKKMGIAMNYLQEASNEQRRMISLDIIDFLTEIKA